MILCIDIGNTNTKLAVFDEQTLKLSFRLETKPTKTSDEYAKDILDRLNKQEIQIDGIIISSVVPQLNYTFEHACSFCFGIKPHFLKKDSQSLLKICYDNPAELGSDRISGAYASAVLYGTPAIVIDYGTATTFTCVDQNLNLLGGLICPGFKSGMDALIKKTSRLFEFELEIVPEIIGTTTVTNLQSGFVNSFIGMTEYIVNKLRQDSRLKNAQAIATGGMADVLKSGTQIIDVCDRALTLKGLNLIYAREVCGKNR